jgi:hypothetical protein
VKRVVAISALAALSLGLAGCGGGAVAGQPSAGGGATGATVAPSSAPTASGGSSPSSGSSGGGSLSSEQACSLVSSADLQQLNASSPPSNGMTGPAKDCEIDTASGLVQVTIIELGLSQLQPQGPITDVTVGGHQAKKMPSSSDNEHCTIAIGVSDSSRVDVDVETGSLDGPAVDACTFATQAAQLVEPHLPAAG